MRYTSNNEEVRRLVRLVNEGCFSKRLIRIKMLDGSFYEGAVLKTSCGNNAGENGIW